ncbi:GNAT family N-acetyltransferase [Methyloferula stellata]|uniref:GNAT family N-acetyltransferase n=1 Tax=Methyloferula stellata TaxID=876270 RepID=UPI000375FFAF|nr:GNAT family N-acetyltransferase [Methyloferula stellata]
MSLLASGEIVTAPQIAASEKRRSLGGLLEVCDDPSRALSVWQELIAVAPASPYQTPGFLLPWLATRGAEAKIEPLFIQQRDGGGTALALFCLGIKSVGPFRAAVFLGEKDSNFNFALFRPGFAPDRAAIIAMLHSAARMMGAKAPDLFLLLNQPVDWNGWPNPLATLPRQWSPSFAYKATLGSNAETFFNAKLSKDTRKKLRKKENRLAEIGPVRYVTAGGDSAMRQRIIEAFFAQKIARFETQKIDAGFDGEAMRNFVETASRPSDANRLELHALLCGENIVAVYGGATHQTHFSGFFNSFDADPEIAKSSPGDLLLLKLIAAKCAQGVTTFDLGIGEARYKQMVCDEAVPLFDSFIPVTWKGSIAAIILSLSQRVKRGLKQNRKAFETARRLRALLFRKA